MLPSAYPGTAGEQGGKSSPGTTAGKPERHFQIRFAVICWKVKLEVTKVSNRWYSPEASSR